MTYRDFGRVIDQNQAANTNSEPLDLLFFSGCSIHTKFGAVTGALKVQESNDLESDWQDSSDISFTQPAGSADGELINIVNLQCRYIRLVYTHSTGTGALRVTVCAKGKGL